MVIVRAPAAPGTVGGCAGTLNHRVSTPHTPSYTHATAWCEPARLVCATDTRAGGGAVTRCLLRVLPAPSAAAPPRHVSASEAPGLHRAVTLPRLRRGARGARARRGPRASSSTGNPATARTGRSPGFPSAGPPSL